MNKSEFFKDLLLDLDEDKIIENIEYFIRKTVTDDIFVKEGLDKLILLPEFKWLLNIKNNIGIIPKGVYQYGDLIGIAYPDCEVGILYKWLSNPKYRIPKDYNITEIGIYYKNKLIFNKSFIPISLLNISGYYQTFYKMYNLLDKSTYTDNLTSIKNKELLINYIQECIQLNIVDPGYVKIVNF